MKPVPTEVNSEFFHIPGVDTAAISHGGRVLDLVRNVELPVSKPVDWYPSVTVGSTTTLLHRLLAMTFIECSERFEDMQVNHIDGDKANFELTNLEWVTVSENAIHAYRTGLRTDNRPVSSINLLTGEVKDYYSLQECSRAFGVNASKVYAYLHGRRNKPFELKFTLKYDSETWLNVERIPIGRGAVGKGREILAIQSDPRKLYIFDTVTTAGRELGVKEATIRYHLNLPHPSGTDGWIFHYLSVYEGPVADAERVVGARWRKTDAWKRSPVAIRVTNLIDGVVSDWPSTEAFALSAGVKKNTLQKALLVKGGVWSDFRVEYLR